MAINVGEVSARLSAITSPFEHGMSSSVSIVEKLERVAKRIQGPLAEMQTRLDRVSKAAKSLVVPSAAAFGGLILGMRSTINAASDMVEANNVLEESYGDLADSTKHWVTETGSSLNRSRQQMREFAGTMQAMLKPTLGNNEAAAQMSRTISELAVHMGSFWNTSDVDALNALRSGLIGETEPLRRFGVVMSEASLEQFRLTQGIRKSVAQMTEAEKVQLRYAFIMDRTKIAWGDAIRTGGSYSNVVKGWQAAIQDLREELGTHLLPAATKVTEIATRAIRAFSGLDDDTKRLVLTIGGIATGVVGAVAGLGLLMSAFSMVAQVGTLVAGVIGLIFSPVALGIVAVIAAVGLFRRAWEEDWGGIQTKTQAVWEKIGPILKSVGDWTVGAAKTAWEWTVTGLDWVRTNVIPWVKETFATAWNWTVTVAGTAWDWLKDTAWPWLSKAASTTWSWAVEGLEWIKDKAASWLEKGEHKTTWSWTLVFDESKLDRISKWFSQTFKMPDIEAPSFREITDAFAKFEWPALPPFVWPVLPEFVWPNIPPVAWPVIQPPDSLADAITSVSNSIDGLKTSIAQLEPPGWPQFEIPQTVIVTIQDAGTALAGLAESVKSAVPPNIAEWETFQNIVSKLTSTPLGQFSVKFSGLAKEVLAGDKPLGQALTELLESNLSIPAGAFAVSLLPIGGGWKLALTGVLLALNLLPDVDLSLESLKQVAGNIYGKIGRFFGYLGRRFAKMKPNEVMAGIQVLDITPSLNGLKDAGSELRSAMESFEIPEGTDVAMEEYARNLGTGISASIAMAVAGILSNGPALVEALASFLVDIQAGFAHLGREIGLKIVGPFIGGFIEGIISIPFAIADAIVDKVRTGLANVLTSLGLSQKEAQSRVDKIIPKLIPDAYQVDPDVWNQFGGKQGLQKLPGSHAIGGFTANVAPTKVAGVVHGGEWVMPAWMVDRFPSLARMLESMRLRGYQTGGSVGTLLPPGMPAELAGSANWLSGVQDVVNQIGHTLLDGIRTIVDFLATVVNALGRALLGDETWNKVKDQIEAARKAVSDFVDAIVNGADSQSQAQEAAAEAAVATTPLWNRVKESLSDIVTGVGAAMLAKAPIASQAISAGVQGFQSGGPMGAAAGVITSLISNSETFSKVMAIINPILQMVADTFGQLIEPLTPLLVIINVLAQALLPILASAFELMEPALKYLFQVVRGLALFVLYVVKGIGDVWNGIVSAVQSVFRMLGNISIFGARPLGFLNSWADSLSSAKMDTEGLAKAIQELEGLSWDAAKAKAEELAATKQVTEDLINVPQALNLNLTRWRSAVVSSLSVESAATGGYIQKTGLLNVHKGELVTPAHVVRRGERNGNDTTPIIVQVHIRNAYGTDDIEQKLQPMLERGMRKAARKAGIAGAGVVFNPA